MAGAIALELGIDAEAVVRGFASATLIPGRFERITGGTGPVVVVDYAHTPDAIEAVVVGARQLSTGRIIVVFGAGGDRDREKRPAMGRAACSADLVILTSDNPRSEDPSAIVRSVRSGIERSTVVVEELDRRHAIRRGLEAAGPEDTVLILGKGHEPGQEVAGRIEPFDDRVVALAVLRTLSEESQ